MHGIKLIFLCRGGVVIAAAWDFTAFLLVLDLILYRTRVIVHDGKWHHVCITWRSSNGSVEAYKDGVLQRKHIGVITGQRIAPSGIWIIGQDQDSYGGNFEEREAFEGSLTDVNVWNRVLNSSEIFVLASKDCGLGMQGNYIAYKDFVPRGIVGKFEASCRN